MKATLELLLKNPDVLGAAIFCLSAALGQVFHSVKKWASGEVEGIFDWLSGNAKRTVGAAIGNFAGMLIFIQSGVLGPMIGVPNGWWAIFLFGFMQGFAADSGLNKATRAQWTPEQRAEKSAGS